MKKLSKHLQNEFTTDGYNVFVKSDFKFTYKGKQYTIKSSDIYVTPFKSKSDPDLIVSCSKTIRHPFILSLADKIGIELKNYTIIKRPDDNDKLWGYATIIATDGDKSIEADGEVHTSNLTSMVKGYAFTMLRKRAEDRAILKLIGLYQHGFYSDSEIEQEQKYDDTKQTNVESDELLDKIRKITISKGLNREQLEDIAQKTLGITNINWKQLRKQDKISILDALHALESK